MTIKNFFEDLWLTVRYGKWRVMRRRRLLDGNWGWQYRAERSRTGERIYCLSKRIAEGACAAENDLRSTKPSDGDLRLP